MKSVIVSMVLVASFAQAGTGVTGGEHSVGVTPIDISHAGMAAAQPMEPTKDLSAYESGVAPLLAHLQTILPEFATVMRSVLVDKRWFFTDEKMSACGGGNSMVNLDLTTRACQNKNIVVVDKAWLLQDSTDANGQIVTKEEKQRVTLVHEMLRGLVLKNPDIEEIDLQMMVRVLLGYEGTFPDDLTLARRLKKLGFGDYATVPMSKQVEAFKKKILSADAYCDYRDVDYQAHCPEALKDLKNLEKQIAATELSKSLRDSLSAFLLKRKGRVSAFLQAEKDKASLDESISKIISIQRMGDRIRASGY